MAEKILSKDEIKTMEMLGFFFYTMGLEDRALRTAKALIAIDPDNIWARQALVAIAYKQERYQDVLDLTLSLDFDVLNSDAKLQLAKLKARALFKLGKSKDAQKLMSELIEKENM